MEVDGPRPTLEFGESDGYRKERAGSLSIGAGTYGCTHGSKRLPCSSINPRPLCLCCLCDWQAPTSPRGYTAYRYTALHIAAGFEEKSLAKIHRTGTGTVLRVAVDRESYTHVYAYGTRARTAAAAAASASCSWRGEEGKASTGKHAHMPHARGPEPAGRTR